MQTQNSQMENTPNSQIDDDEINLMDILLVIAKYNRFIIFLVVLSVMAAYVYALRQPILYSANVLIMPPKSAMNQTGLLIGQLSSLGLDSGSGSGSGSGPSISVLIRSQKLAYRIVEKLDLQSVYKVKSLEAARNVLTSATNVAVNKDGTIFIECLDKDPKMTTLMAKTYIEELDKFNNTIAVTNASRTRLYLEKQLKIANLELANREVAMKESQKNTDLTPSEVQTGSMANLIVTLRGQITSKELELAALRAYATEQNPTYRNAILSLAVLRAQLQKLESDNGVRGKDTSEIKGSSKTGSEFLNNMRDLRYQQSFVESLKKQYDIAKMDEAKDVNLIQVLNEPITPEQPSKPRRVLIVAIGALFGLFMGIVLAFILNGLDKAMQNSESARRLDLLKRYLKFGK